MENVRGIQRLLGGAWTGVKFYFEKEGVPHIKVAADLRFCEAVVKARAGPLLLLPDSVSCHGANYVFGWDGKARDKIIAELVRGGMDPDAVDKLISHVPVLKEAPTAIGLNTEEVPDLVISYCQPTTAMNLLRLWQAECSGDNLVSSLSSILSVCGNVSVSAYVSENVSLSFGCKMAREFGGIGRDRLVIGAPFPLIEKLNARHMELQNVGLP